MATTVPPSAAGAATNAQQQVNGLVQQDREKNRVAVHTFDPNSTPEQKAAAAGKGSDQLKSAKKSEQVASGKGKRECYLLCYACSM